MPSIYDIKPRFQAMLRPVTRRLAELGVTANQITIAAALTSALAGAGIFIWRERPEILLLLPAALFARMALNAIDGMLAREHDMKSNLGALLNELGDVLSDAALYLPLAVVPGFRPGLMVPLVVLAITTEMAGVVAVQLGASRRYDGPMGKSDRAFVFGAVGLAVALGVAPGRWLDAVLGAVVVLLLLTMVNRSRKALEEVR